MAPDPAATSTKTIHGHSGRDLRTRRPDRLSPSAEFMNCRPELWALSRKSSSSRLRMDRIGHQAGRLRMAAGPSRIPQVKAARASGFSQRQSPSALIASVQDEVAGAGWRFCSGASGVCGRCSGDGAEPAGSALARARDAAGAAGTG
jgi:hypothetical protein